MSGVDLPTAEFVRKRLEGKPLPEIENIGRLSSQAGSAAPSSVARTTPRYRELCRFYRAGRPNSCRNGDACPFVHDKGESKAPS